MCFWRIWMDFCRRTCSFDRMSKMCKLHTDGWTECLNLWLTAKCISTPSLGWHENRWRRATVRVYQLCLVNPPSVCGQAKVLEMRIVLWLLCKVRNLRGQVHSASPARPWKSEDRLQLFCTVSTALCTSLGWLSPLGRHRGREITQTVWMHLMTYYFF